jgi:transcription antitermination factor NusG
MYNQVVDLASANEPRLAWYALYTKHQHEKIATDSLERKGFEVLLPLYRTTSRWKDRTKTLLLPLFPCYSFVRADIVRKAEIVKTPGVFWIVEMGGRASPIPDAEIEMIRRVTKGAAKAEPHPFLKRGDVVRVRSGALEGLEGILVQVKNQNRVVMNIDALMRGIAVEVEFSMLERVSAAGERLLFGAGAGSRYGQSDLRGSPLESATEAHRSRIG